MRLVIFSLSKLQVIIKMVKHVCLIHAHRTYLQNFEEQDFVQQVSGKTKIMLGAHDGMKITLYLWIWEQARNELIMKNFSEFVKTMLLTLPLKPFPGKNGSAIVYCYLFCCAYAMVMQFTLCQTVHNEYSLHGYQGARLCEINTRT